MKLLSFLILLGAATWAAPVTSGSFVFTGVTIPRGNIVLQGDGFDLYLYAYDGFWNTTPVPPGTTVDMDIWASDFGRGTATIAGVSYPRVIWSSILSQGISALRADASPVQLTGPGTFYGTFQFTGELCGYIGSASSRPCDLRLESLTGSGVYAFVTNQVDNGNGTFRLEVNRATFTFDTPEPASLWTVAAGLCLLGACRRIRCK